MSFSASFLFQGQSVSDPFPAVSEGDWGQLLRENRRSGKGNPGLEKTSDNELSITRRIQALDGDMTA